MLFSEQKLKQIGESLHRHRVEQNITLEDVAAKTLIAKRVLVALEEGKLQDLPEPFYIKAFISKYAQAIGATDILEQEIEQAEEIPIKRPQLAVKPEKASHNPSVSSFQLRSKHLYFVYLILVIVAVRAIAGFLEQPVIVEKPTIPEPKVEKTNPENRTTPTTISSASPSQFVSQSTSNNSQSVVVDITLKDRCWLKVMVDGKVEFEGTLPKGTQRSWTGREQINIIAGNAGGVVITYNHGQERLLGKPGQVEEVTYTVN